jgi:hypothetical protein
MLEQILSKVRQILGEAQLNLSVDMAAAIEQVYGDIENLINFINREIDIIESDFNLDESAKRAARREILENAGRRFEVIKTNRTYAIEDEALESKSVDTPAENDNSLLKFLREREIRDRLIGMTEAQIKSHFGESLFDGSNLLLIDAILNAPPGFEPLSENTLKKLRKVRAMKLSPEAASEVEGARELNMMVEKILTLVKKELDRSRKNELPIALTKRK